MVLKPVVNNEIFIDFHYHSLSWWTPDFWTINSKTINSMSTQSWPSLIYPESNLIPILQLTMCEILGHHGQAGCFNLCIINFRALGSLNHYMWATYFGAEDLPAWAARRDDILIILIHRYMMIDDDCREYNRIRIVYFVDTFYNYIAQWNIGTEDRWSTSVTQWKSWSNQIYSSLLFHLGVPKGLFV